MKKLYQTYTGLVLAFLYLPIFVLIVFSFNASKSRSVWGGFSLKWYKELFSNELIMMSLRNTLLIAAAASIIAALLGTAAAIGIYALRRKWFKSVIMNITYMPIMNPEIVTGVSMLLLFVFWKMDLGYLTLIIAHVTFCTPYVILQVLPKLRQMDKFVYEAALDLGCSPRQAFGKVVVPEIMPGIFNGFLMAFTYSMDDFVISYFVSDAASQTLPVTIGSMVRRRISPEINALSALIFVTVLVILIVINICSARKEKQELRRGGGSMA